MKPTLSGVTITGKRITIDSDKIIAIEEGECSDDSYVHVVCDGKVFKLVGQQETVVTRWKKSFMK